jgi:hypothetical protein
LNSSRPDDPSHALRSARLPDRVSEAVPEPLAVTPSAVPLPVELVSVAEPLTESVRVIDALDEPAIDKAFAPSTMAPSATGRV